MVASKSTFTTAHRVKFKKKSFGVHAKSKTSGLKTSKNYKKRYVGQGKN